MPRKMWVFLATFVGGVLADQATKLWIYTQLHPRDEIEIIPGFFSIVHAQNPGAAMGLLRDFEYRYVLFGIFTVVALGIIIDLFRKLKPTDLYMSATLGLILSGAVGNGIDRIHKRTVTDFFRFYTENESITAWLASYKLPAEYPTFNVADISLVVGVILFVLHFMFLEDEAEKPKEAEGGAPTPPSGPATTDPAS